MDYIDSIKNKLITFSPLGIKYDNDFENYLFDYPNPTTEHLFLRSLFLQLSTHVNSMNYITLITICLRLYQKYSSCMQVIKNLFNITNDLNLSTLFTNLKDELILHKDIFTIKERDLFSIYILKSVIEDRCITIVNEDIDDDSVIHYNSYLIKLNYSLDSLGSSGRLMLIDEVLVDFLNENGSIPSEIENALLSSDISLVLLTTKTVKDNISKQLNDHAIAILDRVSKDDYLNILHTLGIKPLSIDLVVGGSIDEYSSHNDFSTNFVPGYLTINSDKFSTIVMNKYNPTISTRRKKTIEKLIDKYRNIYYSILSGESGTIEYTFEDIVKRNTENLISSEFINEFDKFIFYKFYQVRNEFTPEEVSEVRKTVIFRQETATKCFYITDLIINS
jgi:hypothetical protein